MIPGDPGWLWTEGPAPAVVDYEHRRRLQRVTLKVRPRLPNTLLLIVFKGLAWSLIGI